MIRPTSIAPREGQETLSYNYWYFAFLFIDPQKLVEGFIAKQIQFYVYHVFLPQTFYQMGNLLQELF